MARIAIMGTGGWGLAVGIMADRQGHKVTMWSAFDEEISLLDRDREHKKLLPGIKIKETITLTTDKSAAAKADIVLMAIPSGAFRKVAAMIKDEIRPGQLILSISKGFDETTLEPLSQVLEQEIPQAKIAVLSGPSHAEEVGRGVPTVVCVSAKDRETAEYIQDTLMGPDFRIYTTPDMVGVELGGALKNVIALAAGISDGMELGDNTKAALMTRGLTEMARLGVYMGGKAETFAGLSGVGDLIVTCLSMHSRNRRAGILIGQGVDPVEAVRQIGTVEGYSAAKLAYRIGKREQVEMPIIETVYKVLFEGMKAQDGISSLMSRRKTHETESVWVNDVKW